MMLAGFCLLLFFSMGIYTLIRIPPELCFLYAVILNAEVMQVLGYASSIRAGCIGFSILAVAGLVLFLLRSKKRVDFFTPGILLLFLLFAASLVLFRGGFIHNYDDFHQWALEVKYMLEHNAMPRPGGLMPIVPMETGLFNVFFQVLCGYNEGYMHASSFLFTAAALVLPLAGIPWRRWKGALGYLLLTYLGMFSIYKFPYKSLYVDLPAAAWAAVLCVWWMTAAKRDRRQGMFGGILPRLIPVIPILLFITRIKWGIGLLLAALTAGYIVIEIFAERMNESPGVFWRRQWKRIVIVSAVLIVAFGILWAILGSSFVPASMSGIAEALTVSSEKARLTLETLLQNLFQKSLTTHPNMRLYTVHSVILLIVLLLLTAYLGRAVYQKKICRFAAYYPVCVAAYAAALYVSYVSTFSYEESVRNATGYRYLSVIVLYGFFVLTGMMLHSFGTERGLHRSPEAEGEILCSSDMEGRGKALPEAETGIAGAADTGIHGNVRWKMQAVLIAGLFALALCNVNSKILYLASEIQEWKLPQYPVIMETRGQIEKIQDVISEDDRVYLLSNKYDLDNMNEYPLCVALYYLGEQVSNYLVMPWQFNEKGSLSFVAKSDLTIDSFPALLRDGGYTYIWIHSYDKYLTEQFERLFNCKDLQKGLYRILYQEDGAIRLEYVSDLKRGAADK